MSHTPVRCAHEGIHEFPRVTVEKYSPDQTDFAQRLLDRARSFGRRLEVRGSGLLVATLHGDLLREMFGAPEDGIATSAGNIMVTTGLQNLGYLLLGTAASGANGRPLTPTNSGGTSSGAICGVGSGTAAAAQADTHLTDDGSNAWYQQMDATYPTLSGTGVAGGGQLNGQCTVPSGDANWAWNEWCWASCLAGTVTPGATLASVATDVAMFNHDVPEATLGTKGAGAVWVFSTTMTYS